MQVTTTSTVQNSSARTLTEIQISRLGPSYEASHNPVPQSFAHNYPNTSPYSSTLRIFTWHTTLFESDGGHYPKQPCELSSSRGHGYLDDGPVWLVHGSFRSILFTPPSTATFASLQLDTPSFFSVIVCDFYGSLIKTTDFV